MSDELVVVLDQEPGAVVRHDRGQLTLAYERSWQARDDSYPLSLSMPLAQREHGDEPVRAYMEGLLPDNAQVLSQWGRRFGVSARNPFSLLCHVGEDVAGAAQFVLPERVERISQGQGDIEWIDEAEIAATLRALATDPGAWRPSTESGQFSLAGAQPKTALALIDGRWGIPRGAAPTTHILKPPTIGLDHFAENEHLCLRLAQELEISAANSTLMRFEDQAAIVVERYDRALFDGRLLRLHQEDLCQSLAVTPRTKYESEGGPGAVRIIELLRDHSSAADQDIDRFVQALALNWMIGGSDAHGKNYSVLIGPGAVRLAPLYDLASVLPYPQLGHARDTRLAMRLGGENRTGRVRRRHWGRLAEQAGLDPEHVFARVDQLASSMAEALDAVIHGEVCRELDADFGTRLRVSATENAMRCRSAIANTG